MGALIHAPLAPGSLEPLLRLALVPGVGPQRLSMLVRHFGSAEQALAARPREVRGIPRVGPQLAGRLAEAGTVEARTRAETALRMLRRLGAVALTPDDVAYPAPFRALADAPYLLFAAGRLELLESPGVAMVGTRSPTAYGRTSATRLASGLAEAGWVVISGMAKGIDAVAHAAALDVGGGTIGVLGHGIEQVYPAENRRLFTRMREGGLLLSEFPPGEKPLAGNFPRRNRLISVLSSGVVVVEMGFRSGAQHTVDFALEQGREVLAVPGPIGSPESAGTNQLIRDGARLVTSVDDILEEIRGVGRHAPAPALAARRPAPTMPAPAPELPLLTGDEARLLAALSREPRHADDLAEETALPPGALLGTLLGLELKGLVDALPGKRFRRPGSAG